MYAREIQGVVVLNSCRAEPLLLCWHNTTLHPTTSRHAQSLIAVRRMCAAFCALDPRNLHDCRVPGGNPTVLEPHGSPPCATNTRIHATQPIQWPVMRAAYFTRCLDKTSQSVQARWVPAPSTAMLPVNDGAPSGRPRQLRSDTTPGLSCSHCSR
jgi:hypothetical protein